MKHIRIIIIILAAVMVGVWATVAVAQDGGTETETDLSGVVVGVDAEAGTVDILQEDGTIVTVTLSEGDYHHPITALLAEYFGTDNVGDWETALETLQTDDGVVVALVESTDADGNPVWTATLLAEDGTTSEQEITDAEEAAALEDALDATTVDLTVLDDGSGNLTLPDISDQIEAYHDAGIGYGELVKIYAIAQESQEACEAAAEEEAAATEEPPATEEPAGEEEPCGVTVEELAAMVLAGTDMGTLFEQYGKPALLGVGHVRQALDGGTGGTGGTGGDTGDGGKVAVCHNGKTIVVAAAAVAAHTGHGDAVGGCP
jgi:hypothetical protein